MAFYYISDLHLCHRSIARRRGFPAVREHDQTLLENLGRRGNPNDTIFLLGDLFAYDCDELLLEEMEGLGQHIVLIQGNHETQHWLHKASPTLLSQVFLDILEEAEIVDEDRVVRMCHRPRPDLYEEAEEAIRWYKNLFGDDFYLELQRHKATVPRANHEAYPMQQKVKMMAGNLWTGY